MPNFENEFSRELPDWAAGRTFPDGIPILCGYECALLERESEKGFAYTIVNLKTDSRELLTRRKSPLATSETDWAAERIRTSRVAGAGRYETDRPVGQSISLAKAREILRHIFNTVLPKYGYAVREEQIDLAEEILTTIARRGLSLCEAETGTGKTLAYLIAAIIAKRGRLNDFHNMNLYPGMQYADMPYLPVVVTTASIALQKAIETVYLPELSKILSEEGIIKSELTARLRKGRRNYLCKAQLIRELEIGTPPAIRRTLRHLQTQLYTMHPKIDFAEINDLPARMKQRIAVPTRCLPTCKHKDDCPYLRFREDAQSLVYDVQVCNHNYLLADTIRRAKGQTAILPNYQSLIIDEGHKLLSAAQDMFSSKLSAAEVSAAVRAIKDFSFKRSGFNKTARKSADKLAAESKSLFQILTAQAEVDTDSDTARLTANFNKETRRHIDNIGNLAARLSAMLRDEAFYAKADAFLGWVRRKYHIGAGAINLKELLVSTSEDGISSDKQRSRMAEQVILLHRAVCDAPELGRKIAAERLEQQAKKHGYNPERQAIANERSATADKLWKQSRSLLQTDFASDAKSEPLVRLLWKLEHISGQTAALSKADELIYWLAQGDDDTKLWAMPKHISKLLYEQQWKKAIPTTITSGTLSAGTGASCARDFSHTKSKLGLDLAEGRLTETSYPSPFDHLNHCLLYISNTMPFPTQSSEQYVAAIIGEVERLIRAAHGHTAVLFTSYAVMGRVCAGLEKRGLPFPFFKLERGAANGIERFKASKNGVLFAANAWEGVDCSGDILSQVIIVKLPFAVPDPVSDYEQTLYPSFSDYKDSVLIPEMLIKLKQGFGRLLRKEDDTGVVALLDNRADQRGSYRRRVLNALPDCRVTADIGDVEDFIKAKKSPAYFQ
jgi:Rad3-related DNA helicase